MVRDESEADDKGRPVELADDDDVTEAHLDDGEADEDEEDEDDEEDEEEDQESEGAGNGAGGTDSAQDD